MPWTKIPSHPENTQQATDAQGQSLRTLDFAGAIREALAQALANDPRVVVMGEGVDDLGGVFGTTLDLHRDFGAERVFDLPIAENGCTGVAVGAALAGLRPVFVHMRTDFMLMAMDQIANHAAKWRYMFDGAQTVPLVIRAIIGRGWGSAAQHSQNLQGVFSQVPGLKVIMPASPYDAKGMLLAAVADDSPVLCIEHRWLYSLRGHVPETMYTVPLGRGQVLREGSAVTVAAFSYMVIEALAAAEELAAQGISAEVLDMRSIKPLDEDLLLGSLRKTGRLVVCDTDHASGGACDRVAALAASRGFAWLKAPVAAVGLPDTPTPASPALEKLYYPGKDDIVRAVQTTVTC